MSAPTAKNTGKTGHHHGNLRAALVDAGIEMLEAGEVFSLRAVARRVGVSQTAPYRHFPDKEHLEAAMAAQGYRALQTDLEEALASQGELASLALAYVHYAVDHPALYRLMFGQPCGELDERLTASAEVFALIEEAARDRYPASPSHGLATGGWALAHGLASLQLDGKLATETELDQRVHEVFSAIFGADDRV